MTNHLTRRQREVLQLLTHGKSNKEIARALGIAEATTKIHMAALVRALGVRNRTEAAFKAGINGELTWENRDDQEGDAASAAAGAAARFSVWAATVAAPNKYLAKNNKTGTGDKAINLATRHLAHAAR